jgi:hypothetical protein
MFLFDINDTTQINLYNIDAIRMIKRKTGTDLSVVINGQAYIVDRDKHRKFISTLDNVQKGIQLTQQYCSG